MHLFLNPFHSFHCSRNIGFRHFLRCLESQGGIPRCLQRNKLMTNEVSLGLIPRSLLRGVSFMNGISYVENRIQKKSFAVMSTVVREALMPHPCISYCLLLI